MMSGSGPQALDRTAPRRDSGDGFALITREPPAGRNVQRRFRHIKPADAWRPTSLSSWVSRAYPGRPLKVGSATGSVVSDRSSRCGTVSTGGTRGQRNTPNKLNFCLRFGN